MYNASSKTYSVNTSIEDYLYVESTQNAYCRKDYYCAVASKQYLYGPRFSYEIPETEVDDKTIVELTKNKNKYAVKVCMAIRGINKSTNAFDVKVISADIVDIQTRQKSILTLPANRIIAK